MEARPWISDRTFLCIRPGDASPGSGPPVVREGVRSRNGNARRAGWPCV